MGGRGSDSVVRAIDRSVPYSHTNIPGRRTVHLARATVRVVLSAFGAVLCIPNRATAQARPVRAATDSVVTDSAAAGRAATDSARARGTQALQSVRVTVTRDPSRSPLELPFAWSRGTMDDRPGLRRNGVADLLLGVPGVQVQDRANPAQDPRIAIRGFGARSAFGVRGVRVLRDGVPLTLPDGQTPLDWLDLESVGRVDVIRGTTAALYGNAAGGVIDFRSQAPSAKPFALDARLWDGGGLQRASVQASGSRTDTTGRLQGGGWLGSVTRTTGQGPRQWSQLDATSVFARAMATIGGTRVEVQGTRYDTPRAENTGALTAVELARDPRLPDSLNITRRSRKAVMQSQLALIASRGTSNRSLNGSVFVGARTLDNPLPFAIVDVSRRVAGGSLNGTWRTTRTAWPLRFGVGADAQRQVDDRLNLENCTTVLASAAPTTACPRPGTERGSLRLNQQERVGGLGGFARVEAEAPKRVLASAALRYDRVSFAVRDRLITTTNLDDSGERVLSAVTPMLGLVWRARPVLSLYANLSTAFETPTITELTNQDNGAAGLNTLLEPQRTRTAEVGVQGMLFSGLRADIALFQATVLDELVPFDVPNQPGRRAFRNAGRTSRQGIETNLSGGVSIFDAGVSHTWSRFAFDTYTVGRTSYAGNVIPGIPAHLLQAYLTARRGGWFATVDGSASSRVSADDASTVFAAGYAAWNARAGVSARVGHVRVEPTVGVENLFDRRYAGSVVINATRARFFEPGLPRRLTFVMRVRAE